LALSPHAAAAGPAFGNTKDPTSASEPPGQPQQYEPPLHDKTGTYTESSVQFGEAPWTVSGKLMRPRGLSIVPAVVLVHGSGPHDEDETIGPNKPFRDLAAGLASNGVAVLRYQKRTFAHRLRLAAKGTITVREEVIDDALEAVRFLRTHDGIDKTRIYVLGHSLGATLTPHIAAEEKNVAGAILLAGSARDFYDVLEDQLAYIASLPGPGQQGNQRLRAEVRKAIARVRAGENADEIKILGVPASYWNEVNAYAKTSLKAAEKLKCRLFIAGGGRDYQITKKDYDLYQDTLRNRKNVTFRWYKKLNHLFMPGKSKATPQEYAKPNHVDEQVIQDLVKWIKEGDTAEDTVIHPGLEAAGPRLSDVGGTSLDRQAPTRGASPARGSW